MCEPCETLAVEFSERRRQAEIETAIRRSKLPRVYQRGERTFDDVRSEHGKVLGRAVIAHEVRGMYLFGDAGEDKTTLACSTLATLIRNGEGGSYENALDLMVDIHASYSPGSMLTRLDIVTPLINAHALLLDDFGKEKANEHSAGVIYQILDGRYGLLHGKSKRVLIIVSNFPPAEACARFGDPTIVQPILRRISEMTVAMEMRR